ncbi:hypothetical protein O3W52_03075 [Ensifer psoraleae]|uniref:Uncharacterized protein n=1 Tax=Sinorhizobium psoraleae TaxID=520838 RepID=A0ABT4KB53_9HYPH|nr:hypothetical protein [Sinorhizobium psoraleae]MCZ4089079.1 hypothetical protein [Sinorhizobium psoraleae]
MVKIVVDLLIQNPDEAAELISRLTNQAIPLDEFSTDYDMETSVAFGAMSRDQSTQQLSNLLAWQMQVKQSGMQFVQDQHIYATMTKLTETAGFKTPACSSPIPRPFRPAAAPAACRSERRYYPSRDCKGTTEGAIRRSGPSIPNGKTYRRTGLGT